MPGSRPSLSVVRVWWDDPDTTPHTAVYSPLEPTRALVSARTSGYLSCQQDPDGPEVLTIPMANVLLLYVDHYEAANGPT